MVVVCFMCEWLDGFAVWLFACLLVVIRFEWFACVYCLLLEWVWYIVNSVGLDLVLFIVI